MNKKFLTDYWPFLVALKEGKMIQSTDEYGQWEDNPTPMFNLGPARYRVKPEPKLRAWKVEEVPINALLKVNDVIVTILGVERYHSVIRYPAVILSRVKGLYYPDGHYFLGDLVTSISCPVYSVDGGKTWNRCGVWE